MTEPYKVPVDLLDILKGDKQLQLSMYDAYFNYMKWYKELDDEMIWSFDEWRAHFGIEDGNG